MVASSQNVSWPLKNAVFWAAMATGYGVVIMAVLYAVIVGGR